MRRLGLASGIAAIFAATGAHAAEFFTLQGHGGPIMGIAVDEDGRRIATASFDNSVGLWSDATPDWLENHRAAVNRVAFVGSDGLVSGGDDFRVVLWSLTGGAPRELVAHKGKVMGLAVSPGADMIASASWDGTIALSDLSTGHADFLTGHDAGVNAVAFDATGEWLYSASADGTLRVWDVAGRSEARQIVNNGFGINTVVLDPGARWLAYGAVDGVTRIVDPVTGDQLADFTLDRRPILAMAYSDAARRLAVGDGEGYIMVIDTDRWRIARDFRATQRGPIWALAMSPDGQSILAGGLDDTMYSWPLDTLTEHGPMSETTRSYQRDPSEMGNGERQFARKCSICHTLTEGSARRAGPTLYKLFGRRAGTVGDYTYSKTLDGSAIVWDDTTIDALFDAGPDHYIPGTKMPMQRIAASQDRQDLIAFLKQATRGED